MSKYIIKKTVEISKPLVFLCGSYYNSDNKEDKRGITCDYLKYRSSGKLYPLIVDNFLDLDAIESVDFSIEKYEELISNISVLNIIYLESFSSASELGLFTSNTSTTKNLVFYPDSSNLILNKIGYFIRNGVFDGKSEMIVHHPYLALVERYAHGTDYVDEYYYFLKNEIPDELKPILNEEIDAVASKEYSPEFLLDETIPKTLGMMSFLINVSLEKVFFSAQTAFYMLYAIIVRNNMLDSILTLDPDTECLKCLKSLEDSIFNTIEFGKILEECENYSLEILTFKEPLEFIKYALFFIKYLTREMFSKNKKMVSKALITKSDDIFYCCDDYKLLESKLMPFHENISGIAKTKGIKRFTLYKNHRSRSIIAYSDDESGEELRKAHQVISDGLAKISKDFSLFSSYSYAYKDGKNTLLCIKKHINSSYFLKMDIHKFFETMKPTIFLKKLMDAFEKTTEYKTMDDKQRKRFESKLNSYINLITISGSFPVGFVSSPIVSEIYLNKFDKKITTLLEGGGIFYTRYADDMLFSSSEKFDHNKIIELVKNMLNDEELSVNDEKTMYKELKNVGDSIRFVGLNIVKTQESNSITIGNTYIRRLARMKAFSSGGEYDSKKITGLENYLKYNDPAGYKKYLNVVDVYLKTNNLKKQ